MCLVSHKRRSRQPELSRSCEGTEPAATVTPDWPTWRQQREVLCWYNDAGESSDRTIPSASFGLRYAADVQSTCSEIAVPKLASFDARNQRSPAPERNQWC